MKIRHRPVVPIVLALVGLVAIIAFVNVYPLLRMTPTPTGAVADTDILALHNQRNSLYFVPAEGGYLLVDAGSNPSAVERGLGEIGVGPEAVTHVLLTHSDSDHVAALPLFPNAQILMSRDELAMVDGTTKRNAFSKNTLPAGVEIAGIQLLEDGQQLELGGRTVTCMVMPGHTDGSMAFLVDGTYLFTGDAFAVKAGSMSVHPFTMDSRTAQLSMARLSGEMTGTMVFTAHYGCYPALELELP